MLPPMSAPSDHRPFGEVCQTCHRVLSKPRTKTSMRASAVQSAGGLPGNANLPSTANGAQPPLLCSHVEVSWLSRLRTKTCSLPSAFGTASGSDENEPPKLSQACQSACGAFCHTCHSAPSVPRAKTSRRPSALRATAGLPCMLPPNDAKPLQPLGVPLCSQMCTMLPSLRRTNTSSEPFVLSATAGSPVRWPPPRLDQAPVHAPCGASCHK